MVGTQIKCEDCGWQGDEKELLTRQYQPDDDLAHPDWTEDVCPKCQSVLWFPLEEGAEQSSAS